MSEIQETFMLLKQVDQLLASIEAKIDTIEGKSPQLESNIASWRELEYVVFRTAGLLQHLGLPDNVNHSIEVVQRLAMTLRILHTTIILLEAASGFGWIKVGLSLGSLLVSTSVLMQDIGG